MHRRVDSPLPEWTTPKRHAAVWRACKVWTHIGLRAARNAVGGPRRVGMGTSLLDAPVIAEHRSDLWLDGRAEEFLLRCGKVQNLRQAVKGLHGIEVGAGETLSFWSQIGPPSSLRGFAVGREIVNGCVVPTVGGGLCQASNALAALSHAAGLRVVEQHRHTALIEEQGPVIEDATVAWNYVDLRIQADFSFRLEARLSHDELIMQIRSHAQPIPQLKRTFSIPVIHDTRPVARGCLTCDETSCFRHGRHKAVHEGRTAVLVNDPWPELQEWVHSQREVADWMVPWERPRSRSRSWKPPTPSNVHVAFWPSAKRIIRQRTVKGEGASRQAGRMMHANHLALHYASHLLPTHTGVIVAQDLVVPLWRAGALGGRSYTVFVPELPVSEIQKRLDDAMLLYPDSKSLRDYRVDRSWEQDEWLALSGAERCLTPHAEVFRVLIERGLNVELLPWHEPVVRTAVDGSESAHESTSSVLQPRTSVQPTITLAASALDRKGARDVATVARNLGARVIILGSAPTDDSVWKNINWTCMSYASDWLEQTDIVLLPAFIEHRPRALLRALRHGLPVVASPACGLTPREGLIHVHPGDTATLEAVTRKVLSP